MGFLDKKADTLNRTENSSKSQSSLIKDPSGVDILIYKSLASCTSGLESKGTIAGERRVHSNSPWPSREEFVPSYESVTSVDVSIWTSVQRKANEMPKLVTKKELMSHNKKIKAWMCLFGKVFDVSGFVDRHPGGYATIEQGIGRDATAIFNKAHSYVNYDQILARDFVGIYMPQIPRRVKKNKNQSFCLDLCQHLCKLPKSKFDVKFSENLDYIVVYISATPPAGIVLSRDNWTVVLWDSQYLLVKTVLTPPNCWITEYCLQDAITYEYLYIDFKNEFTRIVILLKKPEKKTWNTLGEPYLENNCSVIRADEIEDETLCQLFYRQQLTPTVILVGFKIRPSSFIGIPVGYSVRLTINGVSCWYTPAPFSILNQPEPECSIRGQSIYLIMKVSPESILSGMVNEIKIDPAATEAPGSYITLGCAVGTFNTNFLEDLDVLVLITNVTGITPMLRIIKHYLDQDQGSLRKKTVILLYFNKDKTEIIWKSELETLDVQNHWFHVFLAVEEADLDWDQLRGPLSVHLVKWCLESVSGVSPDLKMKGIASGNEPFITACDRLFYVMKDYFDKTFTFLDIYG